MIEVNFLGVLIATVGAYAVGALWYSVLFGRQWKALMGFTDESMKAMKMTPVVSMSIGFVTTLIMTYVLAHFVIVWGAVTLASALTLGFWVWLGFQATILAHSFLYEGRPGMLFIINAGHQLVATLVACALLALVG